MIALRAPDSDELLVTLPQLTEEYVLISATQFARESVQSSAVERQLSPQWKAIDHEDDRR